jgi:hypothetical protein
MYTVWNIYVEYETPNLPYKTMRNYLVPSSKEIVELEPYLKQINGKIKYRSAMPIMSSSEIMEEINNDIEASGQLA